MDLLRLENVNFTPDLLIEGWDSLIWTERYSEAGDFELHSYNIDSVLTALPIKTPSLVTLRDSREVMIVEEHSIETDDDGVEVLITKGRSFETFLEQRFNYTLLPGTEYQLQRNYKDGDVIELLIFDAILNNSYNVLTNDVTVRTNDFIANIKLAESWTDASVAATQWVTAGIVYDDIKTRLNGLDFGIRILRPSTASANIVSITNPNTFSSRGVISRAVQSNVAEMIIEVYDGDDRSASVIFSPQLGHFVKPRSVFSLKDFKTAIIVKSPYAAGQNWQSTFTTQTGLGLTRRWKYVEVGDEFGIAGSNTPLANYANSLYQTSRKLKYFDGQVVSTIAYKYNTDYFLGDLVTVVGNHDFTDVVRVTEYIRSQDKEGEVAYPTLAFVDPDA